MYTVAESGELQAKDADSLEELRRLGEEVEWGDVPQQPMGAIQRFDEGGVLEGEEPKPPKDEPKEENEESKE